MNTDLIPLPEHKEYVYKVEGDTQDIIDTVLNAAKTKVNKQFCKFSEEFSKDEQGLRQLWSFVKYKIVYQKDDDGRQDILLPAALWFRGWGDCKSKTVFIAHVLQCLKIPYIIRFTTYSKGANYTHVYPVALLNGKSVIIDTVFDFFNREKTYVKKLDYPMTKISMISGLREPDTDRLAKEKVVEIEQKRQYITEQEPVELKGKKVGDVRAMLLRRQLQLLRVFNSDDSKKLIEYNKALTTLDKAITKGVRNYKAIGGTDTVEIAVNNLINTRLKDNKPALSFNNTMQSKINAKVGDIATDFRNMWELGQNDVNLNEHLFTRKSNGTKVYRMGVNTPYEVSYDAIKKIQNKFFLEKRAVSFNPPQFRGTREVFDTNFFAKDINTSSFNTSTRRSSAGIMYFTYDSAKNDFPMFRNMTLQQVVSFYDNLRPNQLFNEFQRFPLVIEHINKVLRANIDSNILYENSNVNIFRQYPNNYLTFASYDKRLAFEKYVEEQSGIWDKFINDRVFKEDKKMGCGLLYNWCDKVPNSNMGMYSSLTTSKSVIQQQYMSGLNYLTGADSTILDDFARNTAIVGLGENPESTLDKLLYATGKKPAVGEVVTIITTIIGAIVSILGTVLPIVLTNQNDAKRDADNLSPEKALGVAPIGSGLMPDVEKDFVDNAGGSGGSGSNSGGSGGSGNNNNTPPTEGGLDTTTMLGLGIAAAGAYFLLNKKSKK
jgi:hypothetical protein